MPAYDVKIATTMNGIERGRRVPPLWLRFDTLRAKPLMVIRGANSDLLTGERSRPCVRGAKAMGSGGSTRPGPRAAAHRHRLRSGA